MKQLLFTFLFLIPFALSAQDRQETLAPTHGKGIVNLSVGAGFPNKTHTAIKGAGTIAGILGGGSNQSNVNGSKSTPFFNVAGTYGISEAVDVGAFVGYFTSESEVSAAAGIIDQLLGTNAGNVIGSEQYSVFSVGGKLVAHRPIFGDIKRLDTYASTYLGYNFVKKEQKDISSNSLLNTLAKSALKSADFPPVIYEINAGGRYQVSDNLSVFGEAGYGRFLVNAGLNLTLGTK